MCPRIRNFTTALKLKRFHLLYSTFRLFFFPQKDSLIIGLIFNPLTSNSQEPVTSYEQREIEIYFTETSFLKCYSLSGKRTFLIETVHPSTLCQRSNGSTTRCLGKLPPSGIEAIVFRSIWTATTTVFRLYCDVAKVIIRR